MKRLIFVIGLLLLCSCGSGYKNVKLPEPVRDDITKYINAYLIRPTATSDEEFKEIRGIDKSVDIDMQSFRILYIDWSEEAHNDKSFSRGFIIPIYDDKNIYRQENQIIPYNPWEESLYEVVGEKIRGLKDYVIKFKVLYDMCEGYDFSKLDIHVFGGDSFYFEGASEEEIINYIKQIPISLRMFDIDYTHYTQGYCKHTYLINDVNLFVEQEDGTFLEFNR